MGWILLALVFVAAVSFDHSEGCSCAGLNDLAFQYCNDEKELILRGVALNETLDDGETIQTWDDVSSYAFWITEVVKATGNASRLIEGKNVINIQAGMEGSMCGTSLTIGVEYVIVLHESLRISLCDWVVPYDELQPWDREVVDDEHFNCIIRNCIPMGDMELMCCNEDQSGTVTCTSYEDCVTDQVEETTHCCTASNEVPNACVDYPGYLKKK
ncbi:uncharacterized protein LOC110465194 [Mizuhopecten yessoensis]|uniref:uncharacterized protein LOC110465194 n=1 Tax=Mizuhopecten yessoensis TaxID=6573 RepID=UPI000B45923A|nr:uncharacterized protein LOC110465194 [Mizuhopecten yessoensis]XP_021376534.1 uncharacterized protein LOC110465194 [Mizuhopecten yessoensis]XP_021376535.1 uncharacterized protein LOC110465194 [Mizuhopecten yessoensis]